MNDMLEKRIRAIERAIAEQVEIVLKIMPAEKGAVLIDIAELCRQRRQLMKLVLSDSEIGRAA